jgi:hypothetical protein
MSSRRPANPPDDIAALLSVVSTIYIFAAICFGLIFVGRVRDGSVILAAINAAVTGYCLWRAWDFHKREQRYYR